MLNYELFTYKFFEPNISKWTRFRLLFTKRYIGIDTEGDVTCVTEMRQLKDELYVTHTWCYLKGKLVKEERL